MHFSKKNDLTENDVTDYAIYQDRRRFMKTAAGLGIIATTGLTNQAFSAGTDLSFTPLPGDKPSSYTHITNYCNFYEFGTSKKDPTRLATSLSTTPWTIEVDGECDNPGTYALEDLLKQVTIEERIYRLRCVEGWSMVIPWLGFPLADLIKRMKPNSNAKYVGFETLYDPDMLPGQRSNSLDWPYMEGLRMDEAMNPLTLFSTGLYGKDLLNQNGAPIRLVVPWKYGFKSIKSIVRIVFSETQPLNSWQMSAPTEYGFYANVNPDVSHPRWSQNRERRIGEFGKRRTELFNGYAEQVAGLYVGMDLKRYF